MSLALGVTSHPSLKMVGMTHYHMIMMMCHVSSLLRALLNSGASASKKKRRKNRTYCLDSVKNSCWFTNFLQPGKVRSLTYDLSSSDRFGEFRHWFRMPLSKVESLVDTFIEQGYIVPSRSQLHKHEFRERAELLVMSSLYLLGRGAAFRSCRALCHISTSVVHKFFYTFLNAMVEMQGEYISFPDNMHDLKQVTQQYDSVGLPGACGSMDVVHVKWSACPAGNHNRSKGKAGYPSLGFQCITDFNRRILSVCGPSFGTVNDKHIVKIDPIVRKIRTEWYKDVCWRYYNVDGEIEYERGIYLICDNGYLRWPQSICPYSAYDAATLEGYFSSNIESVRKDVECTFGILKKRWKVLNNGLLFHDIKTCQKIFITCCCLHNFLLDIMERNPVRAGVGTRIGNDGLWLSGPTTESQPELNDKALSNKFGIRRSLLSKHLYEFRKKGNTMT